MPSFHQNLQCVSKNGLNNCGDVLQARSRLCVRTRVAVGRLRRQTYVKFTFAHILENGLIRATFPAVARRSPVQQTTRITSEFTPVCIYCVLLLLLRTSTWFVLHAAKLTVSHWPSCHPPALSCWGILLQMICTFHSPLFTTAVSISCCSKIQMVWHSGTSLSRSSWKLPIQWMFFFLCTLLFHIIIWILMVLLSNDSSNKHKHCKVHIAGSDNSWVWRCGQLLGGQQ